MKSKFKQKKQLVTQIIPKCVDTLDYLACIIAKTIFHHRFQLFKSPQYPVENGSARKKFNEIDALQSSDLDAVQVSASLLGQPNSLRKELEVEKRNISYSKASGVLRMEDCERMKK